VKLTTGKGPSPLRWLRPGMGVKRWLGAFLAGITILSLGLAYLLRELYLTWILPAPFYYLTLQFIPRLYRGLLFGVVGLAAVVASVYQLNRSLVSVFLQPSWGELANLVYRYRTKSWGPRIVVLGRGKEFLALLRGLKEYTSNLTAIIAPQEEGLLPEEGRLVVPADFRESLVALAEAEPLVTDLFEHSFSRGHGLNGITFGNLFITVMQDIAGNLQAALEESSNVLAVRGKVLPSTLENITLQATIAGQEAVLRGREIAEAPAPIDRLWLEPETPEVCQEALEAIAQAEMIILGPGNLYTDVLPNLLIKPLAQAVRASSALKVYVTHLVPYLGEKLGYKVTNYVRALYRYAGEGLVHSALANQHYPNPVQEDGGPFIQIDARLVEGAGVRVVGADLVEEAHPTQLDSKKLAHALILLLTRR